MEAGSSSESYSNPNTPAKPAHNLNPDNGSDSGSELSPFTPPQTNIAPDTPPAPVKPKPNSWKDRYDGDCPYDFPYFPKDGDEDDDSFEHLIDWTPSTKIDDKEKIEKTDDKKEKKIIINDTFYSRVRDGITKILRSCSDEVDTITSSFHRNLGLDSPGMEVTTEIYQPKDLSSEDILSRIKNIRCEMDACGQHYRFVQPKVKVICQDDLFFYGLDESSPDRANSKNVVVKGNKTSRVTLYVKHILTFIEQLLQDNDSETRRGVYYYIDTLFHSREDIVVEQRDTDHAIDQVLFLLNATPRSIRIVSDLKGAVAGNIRVKINGIWHDCSAGFNLSNDYDGEELDFKLKRKQGKQSIIVFEKHCVYSRLVQKNIHKKLNAIFITGRGFPDRGTRKFLVKLVKYMKKNFQDEPLVLGISDFDYYGISIMCTYAYGSSNIAYEYTRLTVPELTWVGLNYNDIVDANLVDHMSLISKKEYDGAQSLLKEPFIQKNIPMREALMMIVKHRKKASLGILDFKSRDYLRGEFLRNKMFEAAFMRAQGKLPEEFSDVLKAAEWKDEENEE